MPDTINFRDLLRLQILNDATTENDAAMLNELSASQLLDYNVLIQFLNAGLTPVTLEHLRFVDLQLGSMQALHNGVTRAIEFSQARPIVSTDEHLDDLLTIQGILAKYIE